jgi:hypothetical protein
MKPHQFVNKCLYSLELDLFGIFQILNANEDPVEMIEQYENNKKTILCGYS